MFMESTTDANGTTLVLGDDLTIEHVASIRDALLPPIVAGTPVTVRFTATARVDLPVIQLLCAAHRTAVVRGTTLVQAGEVPPGTSEIGYETGPCGHRDKDGGYCFWRGAKCHG